MNEGLLASAYERLCQQLLAIRKSSDWRQSHANFHDYCSDRWSLSKTRAKLLCDFATFCKMCRDENYRMPDSPENVAPILILPQHRWLSTWEICQQHDAVTAKQIRAAMDHFGILPRKKIPPAVLKAQRVQKAAKTLADAGDGEKLVEEIGPGGLGHDWDMAVRVAIDADQAKRDKSE